jgi:hypothetical protein
MQLESQEESRVLFILDKFLDVHGKIPENTDTSHVFCFEIL